MPFRPTRLRGLADDHHEAVQRLEARLERDGLTARYGGEIADISACQRRLDFEVAMGDYAASLARIDPFGRHGDGLRRGLEEAYQIVLPAMPEPPAALGGGEA